MALKPNGPGPYTTATAATLIMDKLRDGLVGPLNADVLVRAGVSESLANRTLMSLKILDILDENGNLLPQFQELMLTRSDDEYKTRFQEWLRATYVDVLQFTDPTVDSPVKVAGAFRTYQPSGQRQGMAALLIGLWRYAGLPTSEPAPNPSDRPQKPKSSGRPRPSTGQRPESRTPSPPAVPATSRGINTEGLPPGLVGLLHQIPRDGAGWPVAKREAFLAAFMAVLDFSVPVREQEQGSSDDLEDEEEQS